MTRFDKSKLPSRHVSVGPERAPHRSYFYAMGITEEEIHQPWVGVATCWNADVVATAKRDLQPGEMLDGEGGYTVWGKLLPADTSKKMGGLPLGLAHNVKVVRPVKKGQSLCWADVAMDTTTDAYRVRREMEAMF